MEASETAQRVAFDRGHGAHAAPADEAHGGKSGQEDHHLADDAEDRHDHGPCRDAERERDECIHRRRDEHQARPDEAHDHSDVGHHSLCDIRQIAVHPAALEHHHADDRVDHAWLEQYEARVVGEQRRGAGSDDQKQAQPLHGLDRLAANKLRPDLDKAQCDAEGRPQEGGKKGSTPCRGAAAWPH